MQAKLQAGWRWGQETDKEEKRHRDLLPWRRLSEEERMCDDGPAATALGQGELPDAEKDKDRNLGRGMPKILAEAGYTIVRVTELSKEATRAGEAEA
jgi:hypothetical protein